MIACGSFPSSAGETVSISQDRSNSASARLFEKGDSHLTLSAGVGLGMSCFLTSVEAHDWGLGTLEYGRILSRTVAEDRWYQGNWEVLGQVFGGMQYRPSTAYIVGVAPVLRYNFTPGWRLVPFLDVAAGVTATDIRDHSLSTTFEFNLQAGAGAHIFLKRDLALTLQYRLYHISNAGIDAPNAGVNTSTILAGVSWFF